MSFNTPVDQALEIRRREHPWLSSENLSLDLETAFLAALEANDVGMPLLFDLYDAVTQREKDMTCQCLNPKAVFGRAHPRAQSPEAISGEVSGRIGVTRQQASGHQWATRLAVLQ